MQPNINPEKRIESIDTVRGLVMIIMALDHVRDLLHRTSLTQNPLDLSTTSGVLFFTRWITHLCAPTFVFLSGVSVFLLCKKLEHAKAVSFLRKRGLWLILLELTLINFALSFDVHFRIIMFLVISAIGAGCLLLSFLLRLPPKWLLLLSVLIIGGHQWLPGVLEPKTGLGQAAFGIFFQQKLFAVQPDFMFMVTYPILPWFGIMLLGFSLGGIFTWKEGRRIQVFLFAGLGALLLFVILRRANGYGDPIAWEEQASSWFTILSFLNVSKYPPSLLFDLLFLGLLFLLLASAEKCRGKLAKVLAVYGSVPLFYYGVHLYVIRIAVFVMVLLQGFQWSDLQFAPFGFGRPVAPSGMPLLGIYIVWLTIVAFLYPLCRWYRSCKQKARHQWWVRYF